MLVLCGCGDVSWVCVAILNISLVIQLSRPLTYDHEVERILIDSEILLLSANYSLTYAKIIYKKHK